MLKVAIISSLLNLQASAQFFNFFGNQQQQQHQQPQRSFEDDFLNNECKGFLCQDTQSCVKTRMDCPCPFGRSQLKCVLPNKKDFVCISKPGAEEQEINKIYDDPVKGPLASFEKYRDCGWVTKAYNGLV